MDILELVRKVKALADRGEAGEREVARRKLEELTVKYNLDPRFFEEEVIAYHDIRWHQPWEEYLIRQIAYMVTNKGESWIPLSNSGRRLKVVRLKCTEAHFAQIEYLYDFYHELYLKEYEFFNIAFVQKHQLFGQKQSDSEGTRHELTLEELSRLTQMMDSMVTASPLRALGDGGDNQGSKST